jgi:hypothetical protein
MNSSFIALPLSSGEAFLLRTPDQAGQERVILVDSGGKHAKSSRELARVLANITPTISHIDFAICTHSDADHSNGFWYFADDWYGLSRTIGEYWLPGRWANSMPAILIDPIGFASKLMEGAIQAGRSVRSKDPEEENTSRGERYRTAMSELKEEMTSALVVSDHGKLERFETSFGLSENEIAQIRFDTEDTCSEINPFDAALRHLSSEIGPNFLRYHKLSFDYEAHEPLSIVMEASVAFQEILDTAKAIRKIAHSAIVHDIRVRWFDFGKFEQTNQPSGGEPGLLEPCTSVEVIPNRSKTNNLSPPALFFSLKISQQNVESNVFYRPEDEEPGVLFLGDSRLAHGDIKPTASFPLNFVPPSRKLIVTAPHHGSRNNDHAYTVLKGWAGSLDHYYVRNGGQKRQKFGYFKTIPNRRCAQCVQCYGNPWRQSVEMHSRSGCWTWPPKSKKCK